MKGLTSDMLLAVGFAFDPSAEPRSVGGEGFKAENCTITVRLHPNGRACEVFVYLEGGRWFSFHQRVDEAETLPADAPPTSVTLN